MKTKLLVLFVMLLPLGGCDWFKDLADITINTELETDISVVATGEKSADLISGVNAANFSAFSILSLVDNPDLEEYVDKIKDIDLTGLVITVNGLPAGYTITTLTLDVTGVGVLCTQTNITSANSSFTPVVNTEKLAQAAAKLKSDKEITCTVYGSISGPLAWIVTLSFDAKVVASPLD